LIFIYISQTTLSICRMRVRYPPDEFDLQDASEYGAFRLTEPRHQLEGALLVQVDEATKLSGSFKFALGGTELLKVDVPANDLIIMGSSASYRIVMETWPADIKLRETC
jgi:hypothetical protein